MGCQCASNGCKCGISSNKQVRISLLSAALFYIVANPATFTLVRHVFGNWVASAGGCPTNFGLLLHALVFFLATLGLMKIKK